MESDNAGISVLSDEIHPVAGVDEDGVGFSDLESSIVPNRHRVDPVSGLEPQGVLKQGIRKGLRYRLARHQECSCSKPQTSEDGTVAQSSEARLPHAMQKRQSGSRASPHESHGTSFESVPQNGQKFRLSRLGSVSRHHRQTSVSALERCTG